MEQSVSSLFDLYLARSDLRPSSVRFKLQAMRYFVQWFGDLPVGKVTAAIAEDYRTLLAKGRSKCTANGYLANFRPFWGWLQRHGRIDTNPFDGIDAYKLTDVQRETFTPAELTRLLKVSDNPWRLKICLGLLGCRRGEVMALTVDDVHLSDPMPHILLSPKTATATTYGWELKDHAIRYVALPPVMQFDGMTIDLHALIHEQIAELRNGQPYVCLTESQWKAAAGKDFIYDPVGNFQRRFRLLQKRAGIDPMRRFHELRAAFATAMIDCHGLSRAADALGHASTQTTRRYDRKSMMSLVADMSLMAQRCYRSV